MTTLPFTRNIAGASTYTAEFTGFILVSLWGGGGGGASGLGLSRGGGGGGGGALSVFRIPVFNGGVYNFTIGAGGAGGPWTPTSNGADGGLSFWSDGTEFWAAGGKGGTGGTGGLGGAIADSSGDSRQAGANGSNFPSGTFDGGAGGAGGGTLGGAGGASNGQGAGLPGSAPGGGGSGGGHSSAGAGGNGAAGGIYIIESPDIAPGYFAVGVDADFVYDAPGTFDWASPADGQIVVEAWGSGGGGRGGGGTLGIQGGAGGGGGAYARRTVAVYKDVIYERVIPAGGLGSSYNTSGTTNGADAIFRHKTLRVSNKQLTSNVATLTVYHPTLAQAGKHGYNVGDTIVVAGVDTTFNGTYTVTAVNASRTTISYAKTAANVASTAVSPTNITSGPRISPGANLVLAKGGLRGTGNVSGNGLGGSAASSIGDVKDDGEMGIAATSTSTDGGSGGAGALPGDGLGGYGGGTDYAIQYEIDNPTFDDRDGTPGLAPGGGGAGGQGVTNGDGSNGAQGAVVLRYILALASVAVGGEQKYVVRITYKDALGALHNVSDSSVIQSGARASTVRLLEDTLNSGKRRKPLYIPAGFEDRFDVTTGTFNWLVGGVKTRAAIAADNFVWVHVGDSLSDGSTYLNPINPLDYDIDYPNAFPRKARALIASEAGTIVGGTGMTRTQNVADIDPQWAIGSWSKGANHYIQSSNTGHVATFTPTVSGTAVAVSTVGTGTCSVTIDNVLMGNTVAGAGAGSAQCRVFTGLSNTAHVVKLSPVSGTAQVLGVDVYTPNTGIKVHNIAQGGARAALGPDSSPQQPVWGDTGAAAPTNMTNIFSQGTCFERRPDAVVIVLGGNDSFQDINATDIANAHDVIGTAFDHADTDIILMPDVHTEDRNAALMQLCIDNDWAMIDLLWLSRNLKSIFGRGYNGDTYGHLNSTTGTPWAGGLLANALLS